MKFTEEDYWRNLYNQTEIAMTNNYDLFAEIAERPSTKYHPKLSIKENRWIASYSDVEDGVIIGTGKSPQEAMDDFDKEFKSKLIPRIPPLPNNKILINIRESPIPDKEIKGKSIAERIANDALGYSSSLVKEKSIVINQDGNQFCALIGPNLQEGFAGFGDTPLHAILDLIAYQDKDLELKEILNQKPDPKHWTYKHQQKEE